MTPAHMRAFDIIVGHEGDRLDTSRDDPGNWTSGIVGVGQLRGSRYGISAAAYPGVAIADLTRDDAAAIFVRDYWRRVRGDDMPAQLALLVADAAYNNGVAMAGQWLQRVVGTAVDGAIGPQTMAALDKALATQGVVSVCASFHAQRLYFMGGLTNWRVFGKGWATRLSSLAFQSFAMENET